GRIHRPADRVDAGASRGPGVRGDRRLCGVGKLLSPRAGGRHRAHRRVPRGAGGREPVDGVPDRVGVQRGRRAGDLRRRQEVRRRVLPDTRWTLPAAAQADGAAVGLLRQARRQGDLHQPLSPRVPRRRPHLRGDQRDELLARRRADRRGLRGVVRADRVPGRHGGGELGADPRQRRGVGPVPGHRGRHPGRGRALVVVPQPQGIAGV
ncbi:MAG: hypothetical protein AVDCRST_MAG89-4403, partial [uncultured Gemmatimonadetes bacterium]